ncbi:MAG: PVC-type heme-binding CxxCH protein [Planctomycetota bacterium]
MTSSARWTLFTTIGILAFGLTNRLCSRVLADPLAEKNLAEELPRIPPKEPGEAQKSFKLLDGFRLDLIAKEPLVTDPVASVIDENGRMYVVEMRGYPYPEKMGDAPIGQIRVLDDTDGDGVYDKSAVLVDGLSWPTGLELWKGGVFVTVAPDIWYFKDTDGDDKADTKRKVYTGFGKDNVQGLVNNLKWGLDHWIYGASASNGGDIRHVDRPDAPPINVRGNDFRFSPVTEKMEPISGSAQFGHSMDDWGNRFLCSNSDHAQQVVLPRRYLARNPYLPVPQVRISIAAEGGAAPVFRTSNAEPWRIVRTRRRAATPTKYAATELVPIGFFTSASGITVYRGAAYPEKYRGNLFIGDVGGNLIHRKTLSPLDITFTAKRADPDTEFVTSTDNWFRPVNFTNAPDGTLHVLDMYRETIEHPASIPDDIKSHLDLESGRDRGRIYRLTPPGFQPPPPPRLGKATTEELVAALENPNGWWRDTAHRLLYERQDAAAEQPLRALLAKSSFPLARLHALWSLEGLGKLSEPDILAGLKDTSPGVRAQALLLAEPKLASSPALLQETLRLAQNDAAFVRLQVAFTLGEVADERSSQALANLAIRDVSNPWIRTAILSSSINNADRLFERLLANESFRAKPAGTEFLRSLAFVVGAKAAPEEVGRTLASLSKLPSDLASQQKLLAISLLSGMKQSGKGWQKSLAEASGKSDRMFEQLFAGARSTAQDEEAVVEERRDAALLLGFGDFEKVREPLAGLLASQTPAEVQRAAITALAGQSRPEVAGILLEKWRGYTPPIRAEIAEVLLGRKEWTLALLDAVDAGTVNAAQIPPTRKGLLLESSDPTIRKRAEEVLGKTVQSPRNEVIHAYRVALDNAGDPTKGEKVFERECMTCHRLGDKGFEVGPNLATIQNRTTEALMIQILDPNREVLPNFVDYIVALDDGRVSTGIIAAESANSITLRRAQNNQDVILRRSIEEITSTGKSLMPEGMETKITKAEMADLLAFLLQGGAGKGGK